MIFYFCICFVTVATSLGNHTTTTTTTTDLDDLSQYNNTSSTLNQTESFNLEPTDNLTTSTIQPSNFPLSHKKNKVCVIATIFLLVLMFGGMIVIVLFMHTSPKTELLLEA